MTTGKNTALTIQTFVSKVMSQENKIFTVSSVTQSRPTFRDPVDCSTPGFPVHHQLPELYQTHIHQVGDAIPLGCLIVSQNCHFLKPNFWSSLLIFYFNLLNFSYMKCNNGHYILPVAQDKTLESFCFSACIQSDSKSFETTTSHHLHSHQNLSYSLTKLLLLLCLSPHYNTLPTQLPVSQEHLHEAQHFWMASHCSHN